MLWKFKIIQHQNIHISSLSLQSAYHFLQQLPHQDTVPSHHHLVQDFSLCSHNLKRSLQGHIHENVNPDHDTLDLPASV